MKAMAFKEDGRWRALVPEPSADKATKIIRVALEARDLIAPGADIRVSPFEVRGDWFCYQAMFTGDVSGSRIVHARRSPDMTWCGLMISASPSLLSSAEDGMRTAGLWSETTCPDCLDEPEPF